MASAARRTRAWIKIGSTRAVSLRCYATPSASAHSSHPTNAVQLAVTNDETRATGCITGGPIACCDLRASHSPGCMFRDPTCAQATGSLHGFDVRPNVFRMLIIQFSIAPDALWCGELNYEHAKHVWHAHN